MATMAHALPPSDLLPPSPPTVSALYAAASIPTTFDQNTALYTQSPHEKYFWTQGKPILNEGRVLHLGGGMECQAYLKQGTIDGKSIFYISKHWNVHTPLESFYREMFIYAASPLGRKLQGLVIPRIIGVYGGYGGMVNVAMEPPHPGGWREADRTVTDSVKESIFMAYLELHKNGIIHGDPELRHMLIGDDGRITIIDFGFAKTLVGGFEKFGLERCGRDAISWEQRKVRFLLDFPAGTAEREIHYTRLCQATIQAAKQQGHPDPKFEKPPIPLKVLSEEWIPNAGYIGKRYTMPNAIPISTGDTLPRCAISERILPIPRSPTVAADLAEVEDALSIEPLSDGETLVRPDSPAISLEGASQETVPASEAPLSPRKRRLSFEELSAEGSQLASPSSKRIKLEEFPSSVPEYTRDASPVPSEVSSTGAVRYFRGDSPLRTITRALSPALSDVSTCSVAAVREEHTTGPKVLAAYRHVAQVGYERAVTDLLELGVIDRRPVPVTAAASSSAAATRSRPVPITTADSTAAARSVAPRPPSLSPSLIARLGQPERSHRPFKVKRESPTPSTSRTAVPSPAPPTPRLRSPTVVPEVIPDDMPQSADEAEAMVRAAYDRLTDEQRRAVDKSYTSSFFKMTKEENGWKTIIAAGILHVLGLTGARA
ncbi:hypothetical protein BKA62DRAFT_696942 [Auriculariales sp. MPI-PUGE-AT-0066]|nr:hypothetical protein BKA62DRAFT_696942 [Auriculariales sp. MPI-PUGE-AT-0066]